jgi:hypothetical protein
MRDAVSLIWLALIGLFRSRASLQVEILTLRHQLNVLRRKSPQRLIFTSIDRLVFAGLYRLAPGMLDALAIVKPETVDGFREPRKSGDIVRVARLSGKLLRHGWRKTVFPHDGLVAEAGRGAVPGLRSAPPRRIGRVAEETTGAAPS